MPEDKKVSEFKLSSQALHNIKVEKSAHCYNFYCDNDSPLGEVHDVLAQMMGNILHLMTERQKQSEQKTKESETVLPVED